ncbi:hypothetical protein [Roseateles sp.]|uniref:hypothetical protein n=1 Tax=Roseateles sp. TaxID=1971397 RepID=UPI0037C9695D
MSDHNAMAPLRDFRRSIVRLQVNGVVVDMAMIGRSGPREPVVFLNGFGATKEDDADILHHPAFDCRPFLAWDAPACVELHCGDLSKVSIPFLVATAEAMLQAHGIGLENQNSRPVKPGRFGLDQAEPRVDANANDE